MALLFNADGDEFCDGSAAFTGTELRCPDVCHNPTAEIMQYSKDYLFTVVPFYFFLGALLVYRTAIQSVGNTWAPFAACVIELAARICVRLCCPFRLATAPSALQRRLHG